MSSSPTIGIRLSFIKSGIPPSSQSSSIFFIHSRSGVTFSFRRPFNLAVDRASKGDDADFPTIIAWRETAEFACKYLYKGSRIVVPGAKRSPGGWGTFHKGNGIAPLPPCSRRSPVCRPACGFEKKEETDWRTGGTTLQMTAHFKEYGT